MVAKSPPIAALPPDPNVMMRPVRPTDIEVLYRTCWSDRPMVYTEQMVRRAQRLAQQGRGLGVVVSGMGAKAPQGYGQMTLWARGGEISDLIITPAQRGEGLGTAMIQYLVRAAREMHAPIVEIGVALSNPRALALYRRLGFEDDHTISLDLGDGLEPVLYLRLPLRRV